MHQIRYFDKIDKIWHGNHIVSTLNPNVSAGQILLITMLKYSTKIAQISDNNGLIMTFNDMYLKSIRIAENLSRIGYRKNDVIGFVSGNHHDLTPFIVASLTLGMPINALDPILMKGEIERLFKISKPKIVICESHKINDVYDALKKLSHSVKIYIFGSNLLSETFFHETGTEENFVPPDIGCATKLPAIYVCTSGTTGLSKCYAYSHAALLHYLGDAVKPVTCNDIITAFSSLYWVSGWGFLLTNILKGCTRVITTEPFSAKLLIKIVQKYKITYMFTPPSSANSLLNCADIQTSDFSSLKNYLLSGSAVQMSLLEKLHKLFAHTCIQTAYGSTESGALITRNVSESNFKTAGLLENGTKIKIVDDVGRKLGIHEIGEICTWKDYNFLGYVHAEKDITPSTDGWIYTGDCGYFDENNNLYVIDRKKDVLKYKNYQISPTEIENIIQCNVSINNVCVVGIPDFAVGDLPAAFIIRSEFNQHITVEDINTIVTDKLSDPKQLRGGIYFIDKFPLNIAGKILRRELKELAIKLYTGKTN